jgi:hypothetical protein
LLVDFSQLKHFLTMNFDRFLVLNDAKTETRQWAYGKNLQEFWKTCNEPNVLIWLLERLDFPMITFQELALSAADSVRHLQAGPYSPGEKMVHVNRSQCSVAAINATYAAAYATANAAENLLNIAADAALHASDTAYYSLGHFTSNTGYFYRYYSTKYGAIASDFIRNHIPFEQVAQAAQKMGIDC